MSDLAWQWGRVEQALDYLMTGEGDLHKRLWKAWDRMGEPFHHNQLPAELQPVYNRLAAEMERLISIDGGNLTDADRAKEAQVAMWVLSFYRYLTEFRAKKDPNMRMHAKDILDSRSGPGFVQVGQDGILTGQVLSTGGEDEEHGDGTL